MYATERDEMISRKNIADDEWEREFIKLMAYGMVWMIARKWNSLAYTALCTYETENSIVSHKMKTTNECGADGERMKLWSESTSNEIIFFAEKERREMEMNVEHDE